MKQMKAWILSIALLLCAQLSLAGPHEVISEAYELTLETFEAPATLNGSAAFRACDECQRQRARTTPATKYKLGGKVVDFAEFREAIRRVSDRDSASVTLVHHLESDTVVSIDVRIRK